MHNWPNFFDKTLFVLTTYSCCVQIWKLTIWINDNGTGKSAQQKTQKYCDTSRKSPASKVTLSLFTVDRDSYPLKSACSGVIPLLQKMQATVLGNVYLTSPVKAVYQYSPCTQKHINRFVWTQHFEGRGSVAVMCFVVLPMIKHRSPAQISTYRWFRQISISFVTCGPSHRGTAQCSWKWRCEIPDGTRLTKQKLALNI